MKYYQHAAFRAKRAGRAYYLRHQNGARIRTDRLMNEIWQSADGRTSDEIKAELEKKSSISDPLLAAALHLMVTAQALTTDEPSAAPAVLTPAQGRPLVSVIIVNRDGGQHLSSLLPSLARQTYPNIEVVMVDNGSEDDSIGQLLEYFPEAKVIEQDRNSGFAGGNNVGIEQSRGDYLFLLNNDTELADDCVAHLVAAAEEKEDMAAVVPKMYFWRLPTFINAIGNSVWPTGWGSDNYMGYLDVGQFDDGAEVFSACFGATMISREALDKVGWVDPKYRFYYEDADWSYRARIQGLKIYFAPAARVYHKFNASMNSLAPTFKWQLVIGNRLRFATKNLSKGTWLNFMRNYVKEDIRNTLRAVKHRDVNMALTYARAWSRFLGGLPGILSERRAIQKTRVLKDGELFKLWPELPPLVDEFGHPIMDTGTVRRIYLHFLTTLNPL
jgi:GT2 family glycosyltransferase